MSATVVAVVTCWACAATIDACVSRWLMARWRRLAREVVAELQDVADVIAQDAAA